MHIVITAGELMHELAQLSEVVLIQPTWRCAVLVAQGRCGSHGDTMLCTITHQLGRRSRYMGNADVLAGHQQIVDVH